MKIVLVSNTAWSILNYRRGLLATLVREGHQLVVIAPQDEAGPSLSAIGCELINLDMSPRGANPADDLRMLFFLAGQYRKLLPDLVIHYTIKPNIYGSLAARLAGVQSLAVTTGLGYTFLNDNWVARIARFLYRWAFRYPRQVWFLNQDDRTAFVELGLVDSSKSVLLDGEGIDTDYFSPRTGGKHDGRIRFLLIARMLWDKGVGEFVEAARRIRADYPDAVFQLLGACDVDNPTTITRKQMVAWEREGIIEYLGSTHDVRPYIAAADCVVLPSYREGVPRTVMEAAAMSRPVIVTDVPGCREVVREGATGLLCQPRDVDTLVDCMKRFLNLPRELRLAWGEAGRNYMIERFSEQKVIARYLDLLRQLSIP